MIVGRERELARLADIIADARAGNSSALIVTGEAGIGKTTILQAAAAGWPEPGMVLRGRGVEGEMDLSYATLLETLRPLHSQIDALPPPQAEALRAAFALASAEPPQRLAVFAATLTLLADAADTAPVLILIDDMQWVDAASAEALAFAARRLHDARVAQVWSWRTPHQPPVSVSGIATHVIAALEEPAAHDLVRATNPRLDNATAQAIVDAAGGNPLALTELARVAATRDDLAFDKPLPAPDVAAQLFGRRLATLSAPVRFALLVAAVSRTADLGHLRQAWDRLGIDGPIAAAEDAGLARFADGRLEFRHPLLRSLIHTQARPEELRHVHAVLADVLAQEGAGEWAWHRALAGEEPDEAVAAALVAYALRIADAADAASYLQRAAILTPHGPVRAVRLLDAAEAAHGAGALEAAATMVAQAQQFDLVPVQHARSEHLLALLELARGSLRTAVDRLEAAAAAVAAAAPQRAAVMLLDAIEACAATGQTARGLDLGRRARTLVRDADPVARLRVDLRYSDSLMFAGHAGESRRVARDAAATASASAPAITTPEARLLLAETLANGGELSRALAPLQAAIDDARKAGALTLLRWGLGLLFTVELAAGRVVPAAAAAHQELELASSLAHTEERIEALGHLAWAEAFRGQADSCRAHVSQRFELQSRYRGDPLPHPALGVLELGLGNAAAAVAAFEQTVRVRAQRGSLDAASVYPIVPMLIEAQVKAGQTEQAELYSEQFAAQARQVDREFSHALAARCRGLLASDFEEHFATALRLHDSDEFDLERAWTRLLFGERLRRANRRVEAREQLRTAAAVFEELGAIPWADRAARELAATGERARRRKTTLQVELTPQETHVARLAATGLSNREIGAQLFLSANTIETHMRHVLQKLGLRSRTELANRFAKSVPVTPA